ncbi:MAG: glycosyltransferase [Myxococcota bacterium]
MTRDPKPSWNTGHRLAGAHAEPVEPVEPIGSPPPGDGNDYTLLQQARDRFARDGTPPNLPVSVLLPVYNRMQMLAKTLAGLTHQSYPAELIEVVVADDGSQDDVRSVIDKYSRYFEIQHVYQEDRGYRLSAVRNRGIRAARHDHLILLDCDMIPTPELVSAFMQYLHVTDRALLIGHRRFVCADGITDDDIRRDISVAIDLPDIITKNRHFELKRDPTKDWRLRVYASSNMLRTHVFPFGVSSGCNLAYARRLYEAAGPYCEEFRHWGGEDMEWAYRVYATGAYFIPVPEAVALHQEPPGGVNETDRVAGERHTQPLLEDRCPLKYRDPTSTRRYCVPKVSVVLRADHDARYLRSMIEGIVERQQLRDLELLVFHDESSSEVLGAVELAYRDDPRVRWIRTDDRPEGAATISACRGAYVVLVGPRDELLPHALDTLARYLDTHNVGLVHGSCALADINECPGGSAGPRRLSMFRRRDWLRAGEQREGLAVSDDAALYTALRSVCSVHQIPEVLAVTRSDPPSVESSAVSLLPGP